MVLWIDSGATHKLNPHHQLEQTRTSCSIGWSTNQAHTPSGLALVRMQASSVNLAVTFATTSPFLSNPSNLASAHPALHHLQYVKPAGELSDVLVYAVPRANDGSDSLDMAVPALKSVESVLRVDVLEPRTRRKRDEF